MTTARPGLARPALTVPGLLATAGGGGGGAQGAVLTARDAAAGVLTARIGLS
jgi:hypothetical protein